MSVVVRWSEASAWGPSLEFLCLVRDMGGARALSRTAEAMDPPSKDGRLSPRDPLAAVASRHPGELLWRVLPDGHWLSADPEDPPWAIGAEAAREFRQADVDRFRAIYEAAQERRRDRRRHGR